jgi:hypothetical protein
MSKVPVLLLISRSIHLNVLNQSPRFLRYHFFSLTAMDYLGNISSRRGEEGLRDALDRKIMRVGAQFLLAHLGLAFDRYPVEFLTALLDVRLLYPRLKIGLDKGVPYAIQYLKLSAASGPEINRLIGRLARRGSVFDSDEETQALAACLH